MVKRKVLFVYRYDALKKILKPDGQVSGPADFLLGMNFLDKNKFDIRYINAPRNEARVGLRRFTWFFEFPFGKMAKVGLPIEIYYLYKQEIDWADDIICANDPISLGILFWKLFGKLKDKRVHCYIMSLQERIKYFRSNKILVWFISKLLNQATSLLNLSNFVKDDFIKDYKIKNTVKVETWYFGVDIDFWKLNSEIKTDNFILSIGNDMNRDFETLVSALPHDAKLKLITKKKIEVKDGEVEFISGITDKQVRDLYNAALFAVIPSISLQKESSGLSSALQAMACGKAVIISDAPPLRELFKDGEDCIFYKPEDANDLEIKIKLLMQNSSLREKIGENSYQKVREKFTCKNMAERLEYLITNGQSQEFTN